MARVVLKGIKKVFEGGVVAVHSMDLEVKDKEFVVLVGPSGCGKSTTLRMIAGLEEVTEGTISIDGRVVNEVAPKDRDIAMVFQNYALYPHMTVFDNIAFGLKLRKMPKREIEQRVREAAQILGIEDFLERKPKALSGGQRQRVAVGRAIVRKPKVFLFDEPLSNLDAKLRVQMRTEISRLHLRLGATMIYVTHDQTEAMTMADRIVLMNNGRVQQIDAPLKIYTQPVNMFVAGFIGSPSMNFIRGSIAGGKQTHFRDHTGCVHIPLPKNVGRRIQSWKGKKVVLGIRPEHLSAPKVQKTGSLDVRVDVAEPLGNEVLVYFTFPNGDDRYVARLSVDILPRHGQKMKLNMDMHKVHLFEEETGVAIV